MKLLKLIITVVLTLNLGLGTLRCFAQNIGINGTGATPNASAALDIDVTNGGLLIPRMTTLDRNLIASPAIGLLIFNTDCENFNAYTSSGWKTINNGESGIPGTPSPITGATSVCQSQNTVAYSVTIAGATGYTWAYSGIGFSIASGNNTNSIIANFSATATSGNLTVYGLNACGSGPVSINLEITVNPLPVASSISGLTTVYPNQTSVSYSTVGINSYAWTVPAGATLTSGQGTNNILVNFACNAASGNISVTGSNACGSGSPSTLPVTVTALIASAGPAVFGGATIGGSPTASGGTTPYTYSWNPAADLSSTTAANPTAMCTGSTTTYNLTVTDANSCTATSSVEVTRNLTASAGPAVFGGVAIGGSPTAMGGNPTYTYLWNPATDLSSSTVANPTALCTGSTTTYNLIVTDANSCTKASSVEVTRSITANAGADKFGGSQQIGGSPTASGGNNVTYAYLWSPVTGLSSTTVANPTATPASTTTYTVTVTDANGCTASDNMVFAAGSPITFNYTGSQQIFVVPASITSITIEALGAQGIGSGLGGKAVSAITVTPGEMLYVYVGGSGGSGGWNGGGNPGGGAGGGNCFPAGQGIGGNGSVGGGASDVRQGGTIISNRIIVGGGGGGNGGNGAAAFWCCNNYSGPNGGGGSGGSGGGNSGANGNGGYDRAPWGSNGGVGGTSGTEVGDIGATGGNGGSNNGAGGGGGGGGGGGYNGGSGGSGGGSGGNQWSQCNGGAGGGGGGGGGSSFGTTLTNGVRSGNGQVTITW